MRNKTCLLSGLMLALVASIPAKAAFVIDQQQTAIGGSRGFFNSGQHAGQEFTPTLGSITGVDFYLASSAATDFTLTVRQATLNGDVSGAALASATATWSGGTNLHFDLPLILLAAGPCTHRGFVGLLCSGP